MEYAWKPWKEGKKEIDTLTLRLSGDISTPLIQLQITFPSQFSVCPVFPVPWQFLFLQFQYVFDIGFFFSTDFFNPSTGIPVSNAKSI